ncbi:MAG: DNA repair protein RadC [Fibrobacteria bacterium]
MRTLKDLLPTEWPREKLMTDGPDSLTNAELLAVVLGRGQPGKDVLTLAEEVVEKLGRLEGELSLDTLLDIGGIGPTKGCQILASIEFSRRFLTGRRKIKIRTPKDAMPLLGSLRKAAQESVVVITLDGNNQVIKTHAITRGLANQSQIHPRETFHPAIQDRAVSILVAHNHPSGNLEPSESDLIATRRLVEVSKTLGIPVLDHMIVSEGGFLSIREKYPGYFG